MSYRFLALVNGPVDAAIQELTHLAAAANREGLKPSIREFADDTVDETKAVIDFAVKSEGAWGSLLDIVTGGAKDIEDSLNRSRIDH